MNAASPPVRKRRLGEILQAAGLIDESQLQASLAEQRKWGGKLGRTLVEMGFIDENSMVTALSRQLGVPSVDLDKLQLPDDIVGLLRGDVAERYGVFPLGGDPKKKLLQVATSDPTNYEAIQELSFLLGQTLQVAVASSSGIDRAIRHYYYGERTRSVATATPAELGMSEATFELEPARGLPQPLPRDGAEAASPALLKRIDSLTQRVEELERLSAHQVRAMRGMLELLVEKGMLSREEYISKVRGGPPQS